MKTMWLIMTYLLFHIFLSPRWSLCFRRRFRVFAFCEVTDLWADFEDQFHLQLRKTPIELALISRNVKAKQARLFEYPDIQAPCRRVWRHQLIVCTAWFRWQTWALPHALQNGNRQLNIIQNRSSVSFGAWFGMSVVVGAQLDLHHQSFWSEEVPHLNLWESSKSSNTKHNNKDPTTKLNAPMSPRASGSCWFATADLHAGLICGLFPEGLGFCYGIVAGR